MAQGYKHRCKWFYQTAKRASKYNSKTRPRATLFCWQRGKRVRTKECVNCMAARRVTCISGVLCALDYKQPMTAAEWDKRHRGK